MSMGLRFNAQVNKSALQISNFKFPSVHLYIVFSVTWELRRTYTPSMATVSDAACGNNAAFSRWRGQQLRIKEVTYVAFLLFVAPTVFQSRARVGLCSLWQDTCKKEVAEGFGDPRPYSMTLPTLNFLHLDGSTNGTAYQSICGKDA